MMLLMYLFFIIYYIYGADISGFLLLDLSIVIGPLDENDAIDSELYPNAPTDTTAS
jgi:hypothetical protein